MLEMPWGVDLSSFVTSGSDLPVSVSDVSEKKLQGRTSGEGTLPPMVLLTSPPNELPSSLLILSTSFSCARLRWDNKGGKEGCRASVVFGGM